MMHVSETTIHSFPIPESLSDTTRVWIYLSNRPFTAKETLVLNSQLTAFAQHWTAHNHQLQAFGGILDQQIVVLMVDESKTGASGCSIDKSVHFLQELENQYDVQLFNRWLFGYQQQESVQIAERAEFKRLYQTGIIDDETLVLDTMVNQLGDFKAKRWKSLGKSWHKRLI